MSVAGPEGPGDAHAFPYKNLNIGFCGLGRTAFFAFFHAVILPCANLTWDVRRLSYGQFKLKKGSQIYQIL